MNRRIMGTETEYGLLIKRDKYHPFECPNGEAHMIVDSATFSPKIGTFFANGSRFYADLGQHMEYATPEDSSILGTVANEIAGERNTYLTCENARESGIIHDFSLNKRVIDDDGNSWGHHENFLVPKSVTINEKSLALLGLHVVTVSIFTGAGAVLTNKRGEGYYTISQKALRLEEDYSLATTKSKPVVNLRNEPLAAADRWSRIHVTQGDSNMSPWAMAMRLGTISLVLKLIEHQVDLSEFYLKDPLYKAGISIATDLSLKNRLELANGKTIKAVDIQRELMNAVRKLEKGDDINNEERWVLNEWERACDDIEANRNKLSDRADWVAKLIILEECVLRDDLDWDSRKLKDIDKLWGNLSPSGLGQRFRNSLWSDWMPPENLIKERQVSPPEDTRAKIRGRFINRFSSSKDKKDVNWDSLEYCTGKISILDPYQNNNQQLEELLRVA